MQIIGILAVCFVIVLVVEGIKLYWLPLTSIAALILAIFLIKLAIETVQSRQRRKSLQREQHELKNAPLATGETSAQRIKDRYMRGMQPHFSMLGELKERSATPDAWHPRLMELLSEHVRPILDYENYLKLTRMLNENRHAGRITELEKPVIDAGLRVWYRENQRRERENSRLDSPAMNGISFEKWCRTALEAQGWKAEVTKISGDQGADVIANRDGVRLVVQCKFHNKSIGNSAVQQVVAARHFYGASYAIVVAKQDKFTRSARELASGTGVGLLAANDLHRLDSFIRV